MIRRLRLFVACLVALVLPLQASIMAYGQAAAPVTMALESADEHAPPGHHDHGAGRHDFTDAAPSGDPCHDSTAAFVKCCHSHAVWADGPGPVVPPLRRAIERDTFVARWTSFIPEEPSPPPIAGLPDC